MKSSVPFLPRIAPLLALANILTSAAETPVVVGGQHFQCHFEDPLLTDGAKAIISADISAVWSNWPDSVVELGTGNGCAGRLSNSKVWQSPYLSGKAVPQWLVQAGTNLCLQISADISADYVSAIAFAETRTNEFAALLTFVSSLSPTSLSNALPSDVSALLHGQETVTAENRNRIVSELLENRFDRPSILGVGIAPRATGTIQAGTLVVGIPCHSANSSATFYAIWPAAWIDGRWGLLPLY